jgi:hypothetical protein
MEACKQAPSIDSIRELAIVIRIEWREEIDPRFRRTGHPFAVSDR